MDSQQFVEIPGPASKPGVKRHRAAQRTRSLVRSERGARARKAQRSFAPGPCQAGKIDIPETKVQPSSTNNGLAVWQANSLDAAITNTGAAINGVIYVPNSFLDYTGGSTGESQTIVANTFKLTGGTIAHPANSNLYSSGYTQGGNFIVQ